MMTVQKRIKMSVARKALNYQLHSLLRSMLMLPHRSCVRATDSSLALSIPYNFLTLVLLTLFPEPGVLSSPIYVDCPSRATSITMSSTKFLFSLGGTIFLHSEFSFLLLLLFSFLVSVFSPLECKLFKMRCHSSVIL